MKGKNKLEMAWRKVRSEQEREKISPLRMQNTRKQIRQDFQAETG